MTTGDVVGAIVVDWLRGGVGPLLPMGLVRNMTMRRPLRVRGGALRSGRPRAWARCDVGDVARALLKRRGDS